ncbi:NAD kinase [Schaalia cardiffensis]
MINTVMLVRHIHRPDAITAASVIQARLEDLGICVIAEQDARHPEQDAQHPEQDARHPDFVLAMGGDGTILSAAESARKWDVPLLGVNLGHMGFLAEDIGPDLEEVARRIAAEHYRIEKRMTLDVVVHFPDGTSTRDWAWNETAIIHADVAHPVHLALAVDGQDVSTYGADGIILATPTGSTAYAFSAGGPVVWPDTEAIVVTPLAAHGLFTRPLVVGPSTRLDVVILEENWEEPEMWSDGTRCMVLPAGSVVSTTVGARPVKLVRLDDTTFSTRLVERFNLPVRGWRSAQRMQKR